MRMATLFGRTLRDAPSDAEHPAHQLVLRSGLVQPTLAGGMALLPLGLRVLRRIEAIMHEEMNRIGAQEFRTPVIQASTAWEQSGRYVEYGPLMLRMQDRSGRSLIFGPTHEEAVADVARRQIDSYRQMPTLLYQIHTKYRDELRPRGGLLRLREFTMLDAYSLDADDAGLDRVYAEIASAFEQIFDRCGVHWLKVDASAGEMGGREPREYMALSSAGEDTLVLCAACGYAANSEIASSAAPPNVDTSDAPPTELVATPHCATIAELAALLNIPETATAKAVFFHTERGLLFVVIRGDLEVNETKLRAVMGVAELTPASAEQIAATGAVAGYASPIGVHSAIVVADRSVASGGPLVAGANRDGYHLRNVVYGRDWQADIVADLAMVHAGDECAICGGTLAIERAIEIGHIFKLGTRYTQALGATFLDQNGVAQPMIMGSYGIGLERLMQVIIEQHHDERGIIWPAAVAPFDLHLVRLGSSAAVVEAGETLYAELCTIGWRVLYDDRAESAGIKFADADLLGLPLRVLISERTLRDAAVELKPRNGEARNAARADLSQALRDALATQLVASY